MLVFLLLVAVRVVPGGVRLSLENSTACLKQSVPKSLVVLAVRVLAFLVWGWVLVFCWDWFCLW